MLQAIEPDLDALEVVPLGVLEEVPHHGEVLAAHGVDLALEPALVIGAESLDVDGIVADEPFDLAAGLGRMGVAAFRRIGGEEAAAREAVDLAGRIAWRNADDDRTFPLACHLVPEGEFADRAGADDAELVVRVIDPVAEAVNAQRARVLAGRHAHP